jgi:tetratricopeptide (TPR) repeat protein
MDRASTPAVSRTMTPVRTGDGISPPTQPPRTEFNPPTIRNLHTPPGVPVGNYGGQTFDEGAAFREAAALMEQKNWPAARQALHALAAKVPQSRTYRAWLCYARGREAYIAGRPDEAILEMQRALQLEPDLAHAKHALAELQRRR